MERRNASWTGIGSDIRNASNVQEALAIADLDYTVEKVPVFLDNGRKVNDLYVTKKMGTDEVFGPVGRDYTVVQNEEAFDFVNGIISEGLKLEKAGSTPKMNYIIASLPEQYVLDDQFTPYVIFQNSHAGKTTLRAAIVPLRIVCSNQFAKAFAKADNSVSIRHCSSVKNKMIEAQNVLRSAAEYMDTFRNEAENLATIKINDKIYERVIDNIFQIKTDDTDRKQNKVRENIEIFDAAYKAYDNENFRGTAWGLINAYSDFLTHKSFKNTKNGEVNHFVRTTFDNRPMEHFVNVVQNIAA